MRKPLKGGELYILFLLLFVFTFVMAVIFETSAAERSSRTDDGVIRAMSDTLHVITETAYRMERGIMETSGKSPLLQSPSYAELNPADRAWAAGWSGRMGQNIHVLNRYMNLILLGIPTEVFRAGSGEHETIHDFHGIAVPAVPDSFGNAVTAPHFGKVNSEFTGMLRSIHEVREMRDGIGVTNLSVTLGMEFGFVFGGFRLVNRELKSLNNFLR